MGRVRISLYKNKNNLFFINIFVRKVEICVKLFLGSVDLSSKQNIIPGVRVRLNWWVGKTYIRLYTYKLRHFANKQQNACISVTAYTFDISTHMR